MATSVAVSGPTRISRRTTGSTTTSGSAAAASAAAAGSAAPTTRTSPPVASAAASASKRCQLPATAAVSTIPATPSIAVNEAAANMGARRAS
nr:hypothetical protein GCM10017583_28150 [Agromyces mediolanus]